MSRERPMNTLGILGVKRELPRRLWPCWPGNKTPGGQQPLPGAKKSRDMVSRHDNDRARVSYLPAAVRACAAALTTAAIRPASRNCSIVKPAFFRLLKCDLTQKWHLPIIEAASANSSKRSCSMPPCEE